MTDSKISVIIPVYKVEKYISRCLDSVCNQTYQNLEIILIDDGSPDSSGNICDAYALQDQRIRVIHKKNAGVSAARNDGLDVANGDYVAFIDSDDYIVHNMYEHLVNLLKENQADISICGFYNENRRGHFERYCIDPQLCILSQKEQLNCLITNKYYSCSVCDKLFRREILKNIRFSTDVTHYEDLLFVWQTMKKSNRAVFTSEPYYYYCTNEGSASTSKFGKKQMSMIDVCQYILDDSREISQELHRTAREQFVRNNLMCSVHAIKCQYNDEEDLALMRNNVKDNLWFYMTSRASLGYKRQAICLSMGWRFLKECLK